MFILDFIYGVMLDIWDVVGAIREANMNIVEKVISLMDSKVIKHFGMYFETNSVNDLISFCVVFNRNHI